MGLKFLQIILLIGIGSAKGNIQINLECKFEVDEFATVGRQYTCVVQNDLNIFNENASILDILGTHADNHTIDSVFALTIENKATKYLPTNTGEVFINLTSLRVKNGRLKELHKDDLRSMPKLRYLNLDDNDIEILNDDVFEYNPLLNLVWLSNNKIKKIGEKLAENFKNLVSLDLTKNSCTTKRFAVLQTKYANPSMQSIQNKINILTEIMQSCANFTDVIYEFDIKSEAQDHLDLRSFQEQIKNLNIQLFSTKSELKSIKLKLAEEMTAKNKTLEMLLEFRRNESDLNNEVDNTNIAELEIKLKKEEKEVRNLKDELKKLKGIHDEFSNMKDVVKKYEEEMYNFNVQKEQDQLKLRKLLAENAELKLENKNLKSRIAEANKDNQIDDTWNIITNGMQGEDLELTATSATIDSPIYRLDREESEGEEMIEETTLYDYYS
ncbi:unnamed protein product [Chironomus riparius]|uniref:Uncharacterized protein n=1 Tax=Chironomus riparius TaxID=315576 RepID=A0A9N9WWR9_9DIPT|nr:unnamed protein product [Chironomus riparius]